jgi:hypothetical protein
VYRLRFLSKLCSFIKVPWVKIDWEAWMYSDQLIDASFQKVEIPHCYVSLATVCVCTAPHHGPLTHENWKWAKWYFRSGTFFFWANICGPDVPHFGPLRLASKKWAMRHFEWSYFGLFSHSLASALCIKLPVFCRECRSNSRNGLLWNMYRIWRSFTLHIKQHLKQP